ncbi:MAG: L-iditol 2-dehydrogenase [Solirubrobacteraceae bacterium]|nr:L-iditol 2-dehydrogenase [Solirubrobacteraceae bacterium]
MRKAVITGVRRPAVVPMPELQPAGDRVVAMPPYSCGECAWCEAGDHVHCTQDATTFFAGREGSAAMAEVLLKPERLLVPIPDGMSYAHAAMACCGLGASFGALQRLHVDAWETVLITGMAPVGLGGVINASYRGARVIAVESHPYRALLAAELGAEAVIDAADDGGLATIPSLTGGRGVDKAIECSGAAAGQRLCIGATRIKGAVCFVGESSAPTELEVSRHLLRKGLTLTGTWHYNLNDAATLMREIAEVGRSLDRLITHSFPLERVQEACELQASGACGKVVLRP